MLLYGIFRNGTPLRMKYTSKILFKNILSHSYIDNFPYFLPPQQINPK